MKAESPTGLAAAVEAFRHREFRLVWIGGVISHTGRWFQAVTVPIVVYQLTKSAAWVGVAGFAQIFPLAVMMPLAGAIADRYHRRSILLVTQSLQAVASSGFVVMWFAGGRNVGAYVAMSFVAGAAAGLNLPAWQAFVSELVPRDLLFSAITLNSAQFNASRLFGPALAGLAIGAWGPGWAFLINVVSYGAVIGALALIRTPRVVVENPAPLQPLREFRGAANYAMKRKGIRTAIFTVIVIGMFGLSLQMLSVVMAEEVFDRGERGFGLMLSAVGLGAVVTSPLVASMAGKVSRSAVQLGALAGYAGGILVLGLAPIFELALVGLFVMGAAHLASASTLNTVIQVQVDESVRAKVLSVYLAALTLANPIGQLALGQIIEATTPRTAFAGTGAVLLALVAYVAVRGTLAGLDDPGPALTVEAADVAID